MCSDDCTSTGQIISAGAGHYARAEMVMAPGVRWPYDAEVSPEDIARRWTEITDLDGAEPVVALAEYSTRVLAPAIEGMSDREDES
jgi:hypothetical protein